MENKLGRALPETLSALESLAWNYWWSWAADGTAVFRDLDPVVWEDVEMNPRALLLDVSEYRLLQMATDPLYIERVRVLAEKFARYMNPQTKTWAQGGAPALTRQNPVAYFCAEFGIHTSLPLYSGGLGMLAGDHLKSASDLGLPLVAVGLLYHQGYFRQRLRRDGWQEEHYGTINPAKLPIQLLNDSVTGEPLTVELEIRGRLVRFQAWQVAVGRVKLYLLDSNLEENDPIDRLITAHLYGGDRETRCVQEMVLGIAGIRLLRKLEIEPHVFHLNEGHSAFLTLELTRELVSAGKPFEEAAREVRERCVFTTHTPVAAGHDEFLPELVEFCFGRGYRESLTLSHEQFIDLGRIEEGNEELFGLTPLALKMCRTTNGVSKMHGEVSRELWKKLYPGLSADEVPITYVTNGVHAPTWVSQLLRSLYEEHVSPDWEEKECDKAVWQHGVARMPDEELWRVHRLMKQKLIAFIRERQYFARLQRGESQEFAEAARTSFDPEALTIGFARRVAAYKRWSLILTDPERLLKLINDADRPVQFVFAGKAHPQDEGAKKILQQLAMWKLDPQVINRTVFLQDYDQEIARKLVQGVDVWLNVPRRPLEASGTSGEKVAMNGGLNLSILDGWWPEGIEDGRNGWAIGKRQGEDNGDVESQEEDLRASGSHEEDLNDAESLYRLLEEEVVPAYYERDERGVPRRWVGMMKRAIVTLVPQFNSDRMVQEYAQKIYTGGGASETKRVLHSPVGVSSAFVQGG